MKTMNSQIFRFPFVFHSYLFVKNTNDYEPITNKIRINYESAFTDNCKIHAKFARRRSIIANRRRIREKGGSRGENESRPFREMRLGHFPKSGGSISQNVSKLFLKMTSDRFSKVKEVIHEA